MEAHHELIPLESPDAWRAALGEVDHAHGHTWEFCRALQRTSGLPTSLYRYASGEDRVVCPVAERTWGGETDVVSPYGFAGFATRGACAGWAAEWRDFAAGRGWVCGYVAQHPLLPMPPDLDPAELHAHTDLYVMDLRGSEDEVFRRLSQNRRRQLRSWPALAADLVHDRGELAAFLVEHHAGFVERRGAGAAARWLPETAAAVAGAGDVLLVGAAPRGRLEAVAAVGWTRLAGEYLLGISLPGGERHAAALIWSAALELRAAGVPWLHLGGGIRPGDDVAEFKRRFGARVRPLVSLRQVFRPDAYERLCAQAGVAPTTAPGGGFFPPYR